MNGIVNINYKMNQIMYLLGIPTVLTTSQQKNDTNVADICHKNNAVIIII